MIIKIFIINTFRTQYLESTLDSSDRFVFAVPLCWATWTARRTELHASFSLSPVRCPFSSLKLARSCRSGSSVSIAATSCHTELQEATLNPAPCTKHFLKGVQQKHNKYVSINIYVPFSSIASEEFQNAENVTESGTRHAMATHAQISISAIETRCILFFELIENFPSIINNMHAYLRASSCGSAY